MSVAPYAPEWLDWSIVAQNSDRLIPVIPGPPKGRSPEPMHIGLWKMGSGLAALLSGAPE
jgi:hypothetical protein